MKKMTKTITLLVSALLCVSLVSCGETDSYDDTDYMEAGDDWRTTGLVLANGVITRGGESTEVLVTVGDNGAAFYYDDAGHVIFDEVEYPETIAGDVYKRQDWHEVGNGNGIPQLNFYLPVTYKAEKFTYDIPLGTIERGDIPHDVPGNSFMRIGDEDRAAYIVTETKYGFRGHDNAGALTLIRSSYDPDPYPELGQHQINFGVGICSSAEQKKEAFTFCHPVSFNSDLGHKGTLDVYKRQRYHRALHHRNRACRA